jgi:hypothetical protein
MFQYRKAKQTVRSIIRKSYFLYKSEVVQDQVNRHHGTHYNYYNQETI